MQLGYVQSLVTAETSCALWQSIEKNNLWPSGMSVMFRDDDRWYSGGSCYESVRKIVIFYITVFSAVGYLKMKIC